MDATPACSTSQASTPGHGVPLTRAPHGSAFAATTLSGATASSQIQPTPPKSTSPRTAGVCGRVLPPATPELPRMSSNQKDENTTLAHFCDRYHCLLGRMGRAHRGPRESRFSRYPGLFGVGAHHDSVLAGCAEYHSLETGARSPLHPARLHRRVYRGRRTTGTISSPAHRAGLPRFSDHLTVSGPDCADVGQHAPRARKPPCLGRNHSLVRRDPSACLPA